MCSLKIMWQKWKQRFLKKLKRPADVLVMHSMKINSAARIEGSREPTKIDAINARFKSALEANNLEEVRQIILDLEIVCPISGTRNWTDVRQFNLMFSTQVGSVSEASTIYLRPETAQGIFVNFLNVQKTGRMKIPLVSRRPEKRLQMKLSPDNLFFRMREFEQMEMQVFHQTGTEMEWYSYWKENAWKWHRSLGFPESKQRFSWSSQTRALYQCSVWYWIWISIWFQGTGRNSSRTDFDLGNHEKFSGKNFSTDPELNQNYVPYVVETSIGLDRMFPRNSFTKLRKKNWKMAPERVVPRIPPFLHRLNAPLYAREKDGLPRKSPRDHGSAEVWSLVFLREKDNIGKRYRRQDAMVHRFASLSITIHWTTTKSPFVTGIQWLRSEYPFQKSRKFWMRK